jgi:HK97 family phage major capsid protein
MGTSITDTNLDVLIPVEIKQEIVKEISQNSAVMKRARRLPNMASGTSKLPVLDALPLAYFVDGKPSDSSGEKGFYHATNEEWTNVVLYAEEIACIVPIPKKYLDDANFDIWGEVKPSVLEAMGIVFDGAVLYGTNKPTNWPTSIYDGCVAKSTSVALGADVYASLLGKTGVISKVEAMGYFPTAHIGALSMRGELRDVKDDLNRPIFMPSMQSAGDYSLDGSPIDFPLNGAIDDSKTMLFTGDWSKLVYSVRQDVTFDLLKEAVIQDPTTKAIVYNLAQQNMVALRCTMRLAWALPNPANRVKAKATRYPFAMLTPAASS